MADRTSELAPLGIKVPPLSRPILYGRESFTPESVVGRRSFWFDSSDMAVDHGTPVGLWLNRFGGQGHVQQPVLDEMPVLHRAVKNGLSALYFDGVNDGLQSHNSPGDDDTIAYPNINGAHTYFAVVRNTDPGPIPSPYGRGVFDFDQQPFNPQPIGADGRPRDSTTLQINPASSAGRYWAVGTYGGGGAVLAGVDDDTSWHTIVVSMKTPTSTMYLDGVSYTGATPNIGTGRVLVIGQIFGIGTPWQRPWMGYIGELGLWNDDIGLDQILNLQRHLQAKWNTPKLPLRY